MRKECFGCRSLPCSMTMGEREFLKIFAANGKDTAEMITCICHWMRQFEDVSFTEYAANWAVAYKKKNLKAMKIFYPLTGKRMIKDGYSDWGSFENPDYK